jgi:alkylated DNA repair dioxygenase AlkB
MAQLALFGTADTPQIDAGFSSLQRIELAHGAWIDLGRSWLQGHGEVFDLLLRGVAWKSESRVMYDRTVEVPRRYAVVDDPRALHPVFDAMRLALDARYETRFDRLSVALYRDGRDSVAWHGDYVARRMPRAVVATVSVGAPRKFLLRPTGGGASIALSLGWGDLLVMGGSCQRTHQHAIPKAARADARIAILFRPTWEANDPEAPPTEEQAAGREVRP